MRRNQQSTEPAYQPLRGFDWLTDSAALMGLVWEAGKGSGKSRGIGRDLMWRRFLKGTFGQVLLEPVGPGCDNFLDKLIRFCERLPPELQQQYLSRVLYLDMSGTSSYIVRGCPLYYRLGTESLYEISQRFLDTVRRTDSYLTSSAIEGWGAVDDTGTHVGILLAALNCQIDEAESLLRHPEQWQNRFEEALRNYPEVAPTVAFFQDYMTWRDELRYRKTHSFLNRIKVFSLDPAMRALVNFSKTVDWNEVVEKGITVICDFRGITDTERRRFLMMWGFQTPYAFIKHRGAGRHRPLALYLEEVSAMTNQDMQAGADLFESDLDELANIWSRNASVLYSVSYQQGFQLPEKLRRSLRSSGNLVIGNLTNTESARELVEDLFAYHYDVVKHLDPIYRGPQVIDYRQQFFSVQEQIEIAVQALLKQIKFRFLVRRALGEGTVTTFQRPVLEPMTLEYLDPGVWIDEEKVAAVRQFLSERDGVPIRTILAQLDEKREVIRVQSSAKKAEGEAKVNTGQSGATTATKKSKKLHHEKKTN